MATFNPVSASMSMKLNDGTTDEPSMSISRINTGITATAMATVKTSLETLMEFPVVQTNKKSNDLLVE